MPTRYPPARRDIVERPASVPEAARSRRLAAHAHRARLVIMTKIGDSPDRPQGRDELAGLIAAFPGVAQRLAEAHRPDEVGRCGGCRSDVHIAPIWPCRLADAARGALGVRPAR